MIDDASITEQDLSDLIDGRLSAERELEIRRALDARPDLTRIYASMLEQERLLRRLGEEILREPIPEAMLAILRRGDDQERRAVGRMDADCGDRGRWRGSAKRRARR